MAAKDKPAIFSWVTFSPLAWRGFRWLTAYQGRHMISTFVDPWMFNWGGPLQLQIISNHGSLLFFQLVFDSPSMSSSVLNPGNHITLPEQQQQQPSAIIGFSSAVAFVSTKGCESVHVQTMLALQPHQTTNSWAGRGPLDRLHPNHRKLICPSLSKPGRSKWSLKNQTKYRQTSSDAPGFHLHTSILACKHMQTILMHHCHSIFPSLLILLQCHATSLKLATRTETTVVFHPSAIPRARNANGNQTGPTGLINMTLKLLYRHLYVTLVPI